MGCRGSRTSIALWIAAALLPALLPLDALAQGGGGAEPNQALTDAYNASGQDLFRQFAGKPGNIVFSPYSIGSAMAMVLAGARGETEREMLQVLHHRLPRPQIDAANAGVLQLLNGYDAQACPAGETCTTASGKRGAAKLIAANALMLANASVAKDYADDLSENYAAEVFRKATLADVNGWVSRKTEGKIDRILDQLSDVVIVNAVYFKAHWASVFSAQATKSEAFHLTRSRQAQVPMMQQRANYSMVAGEGYRAIRLAYEVQALGMVVVLPDELDGLSAVAARLDAEELSRTLAALRAEPTKFVALALPRFKSAFRTDLKAAFEAAGMHNAFLHNKADFSGMTGQPASVVPASIDQIVHRAVIDVMEGGTEAAAATAAGIRVASLPPPPVPFRVDRPFLYYIVDDASGAILFQGRVVDPR